MRHPQESLISVLRCPVTRATVGLTEDGGLATPDGSRAYRVFNGIPIMLDAENALFGADSVVNARLTSGRRSVKTRLRSAARWVVRHPPTSSRNIGSRENYRHLVVLLSERTASECRRMRVLVVGSGVSGVGAEALLEDPALDVIETDVYLGSRVSVVCDGHQLPFADATFDAVVCQAVLEHVLDPWEVAHEIRRVLRTDGLVYSEVPFIQQVHEGALDFTRFTLSGHRRVWRWFDEIASGAVGGPGMALIWSIGYFLRACAPCRLWPLCDRVASLGFFWLKYADDWLVRRPGGLDAASGTFFLGRRRAGPLDDRAIVLGYRGGGPRHLT